MTNAKMLLNRKQMIEAWRRRDAQFDGLFVFGVKTTGVVCRPSCPSQPKLENLEFFETVSEAVGAGFRPCKRCEPERANGAPPEWAARLMEAVKSAPEEKISIDRLKDLGVAPEKARRWFQKNHGMTFSQWARSVRMAEAHRELRSGEKVDDVIFGHGYESHSGFRAAFAKAFGRPPGKAVEGDCVRVALIESPLGPILAAVNARALVQLDFAEVSRLSRSYENLRERFRLPVVPGENEVMGRLKAELGGYFEGRLKRFSVPVELQGTEFQTRVWKELMRIPYGATASYEEVAARAGIPTGCRAVARANASNRIAIVVPCHRVIAKDGSLSGYAAGVWRKRQLLELERTTKTQKRPGNG